MATMTYDAAVQQIGETAGIIWHLLEQQGPMTMAKLVRAAELPRDSIAMALGWLAREDKIELTETARGRIIGLRSEA